MKESKPCPCGYDTVECTTCQNAAREQRHMELLTAFERGSNKKGGIKGRLKFCGSAHYTLGAKGSTTKPAGEAVALLSRWLTFGRAMQKAGSDLPRHLISETETLLTAPPAQVLDGWRNSLMAAFPLFDDDGLDEVKHHCEWHLQQDRKRLHAMLAAAPQPKGGE